jgi:TonB family protein
VLKVLEQYIEGESASTKWYATDRRFAKILVSSIVAHVLFYALIIQLDLMRRLESSPARESRGGLVLVTEVGSPPKSPPLRSIAEPLERADTRRMEYKADRSNDTDLVARSPKLGNPEGTAEQNKSPKLPAIKPPVSSGSTPNAPQRTGPVPPVTTPVVAQVPPNQVPPASAGPLRNSNQNTATPPPVAPAAQATQSQESRGTRAFSMEDISSQYLALIRSKISKANERSMPRDWIRDVLDNGVSADFQITIGRGGRLVAVNLVRSSGYPTLDSAAREAIYNARPFEGYPQDAGEQITLTVKVSYAPLR